MFERTWNKSKATGEGSKEMKGFPEFADLDEIWGTQDIVTNKYVVEAGTNDQPIDADDSSTISSELYSQSLSSDRSLQTSQSDVHDDALLDNELRGRFALQGVVCGGVVASSSSRARLQF